LPGLSVHVPEVPASVPQPDVLIVRDTDNEGWFTAEPIVVFEILSPSTRRRDLTLKRDIYGRMATVGDYVIIAPKKREVTVYSKRAAWAPVVLRQADDVVPLPDLGLALPLASIYHGLLR
jgi:Uma2 family endonuclease